MDKIIVNILKKIEKFGFKAFVVGGYVRDNLLGIESRDVDICTNALPKDIKSIFKLDKLHNEDYGSVNIKTKKYNIDITTFRKESSYCKHIPKKITYVNDVKTDLKRRDFTINSILMNSNCEYIDYFDGISDLKTKKIKCIGEVSDRLKEDPLRILRALRFSIIYSFEIDEEMLEFIKCNKYLLDEVSYYRKKEELDKILFCKNKIEGLKFLKDNNLCNLFGFDYLKVNNSKDLLGMYSQIKYNEQMPFTKTEKESINNIREIIKRNTIDNYTLYKYGLYLCSVAGEIMGIEYKEINKMYKNLPIKSREDIKISLQSIVKLNNNCYNNINEIYKNLEFNILNKTLKNKNKDIVKFLRK